jgi:uncharacterized SAM-binding protein YcdF (DUF218 family)
MKKLILHLGGGLDRANKCAQLAHQYPDVPIFVSSEGGPPETRIIDYYKNLEINSDRIFLDYDAWDTVTNFTHTFERIKKEFNPKEIFVVTHDFHMNRSMRIANAVYFLNGIKPIASPSGGPNPYGPEYNFTEPDKIIIEDTIRAWIWRFTGILIYWKNIRQQRSGEMGTPKKWNEIGF